MKRELFGTQFGLETSYIGYSPTTRKRGEYKSMLLTLDQRYGLEGFLFRSRKYGLEDIELELDASENEVFAEDPVDEFAGYGNEEELTLSEEEMIPEDSDAKEVTWEETEVDSLKSDADAINMMEIVGNYHNDYVRYLEVFQKKNEGVLDRTGDITQSKLYPQIEKAMKLMEGLYKDSEEFNILNKLFTLLKDKRKMTSICGKEDAPFLYEGFQLVFFEFCRSLLALWPFCLKQNMKVNEVVASMNLNIVKTIQQMAEDIVEVQSLYGTTLYYVEPVVSDITGRSEELAGTPYGEIPVFQEHPMESCMRYAGESIMNLVEIKNHNALPEYSILMKACMVIAGLVSLVNMEKTFDTILENVLLICNTEDHEKLEDIVATIIEKHRELVLAPHIDAMTELTRIEQEKQQAE